MRGKLCITLMLGLTLLLVWIASACTPELPTPTVTPPEVTLTPVVTPPKVTPTPVPTVFAVEDCPGYSSQGRAEQDERYRDLMYIEGQVVVRGNPDLIRDVTEEITPVLSVPLTLLEEFHLSDGTAIQLHSIPGGESVELVTCGINARSQERRVAVSGDPNYHLSPAQWAGGGSPWTQNGRWREGLDGGGLGEVQGDPEESFLTQWAFGPQGIELFQGGQRTVAYMGEGVRIGVFDSSPFTDEFAEENGEPLEISLSITETMTVIEFQVSFPELMEGLDLRATGHPTPTLTVWHTELISAPNCPGQNLEGENLEDKDLSNHGLFVAGLAHAVAPASEIYLVRVLEDDGCGNLYSIGKGIKAFVEKMQDRNSDGPIVVSLSLGAHEPPNPTNKGLPPEVTSLQDVVADVMGKGAVVVAAAGNDSYDNFDEDGQPLPPNDMEIPAQDPGVIGVAASNFERRRGCFSNRGKVAAPGGDGIEDEEFCEVPLVEDCEGPESKCVISLIHKPNPGYAYWVGTSFATPLVSGQAALLLGEGMAPGDVMSIIWSTAGSVIIEEVEDGQELEIPIINVPNSLQ